MKLPEEWGEKGKYNLLYKYIYVIKVLQFYPIRRFILLIGKEHEKKFVLICFQLANDVYTWR